jgi:putative DNA primase/helicase
LSKAERAEQRQRIAAAAAQRRQAEAADRGHRLRIAERIIDGSGPLPDSPAWHYLEGRCIRPSSLDVLRFSAAVWHPYARREMPAMVGRIEHPLTRRFQGVHVTFLDGERKAAVRPAKIMRGIARGGIVRLAEPAETWRWPRGSRSALSFAQLARIPTWAALSAGNLINVMLPADVREVVIAADNDERGLADARKAGQRWRMEGRRVRIVRPTVAGQDWNDILKGGARG